MNMVERPLHTFVAEVFARTDVRAGVPLPIGTHEYEGGVNFAIFSRHASRVRLELFNLPADATPARVIDLDPVRNRTGDLWHVWVESLCPGQLYAYRMDGPYQPREGHRFNFHKLLLDPFATAISQVPEWDFGLALGYDPSAPERDLACSSVDDAGTTPKCLFTNEDFQWEDDQPLRHPWSKTIIYETHVRGFTIQTNSGVKHPGTYRGLMEKIPYLQELGVTAVELMPVQEFNERQVTGINPHTAQPSRNYWGYDPVAFFAPKASYSSVGGLRGEQRLEFKEMVKVLHDAGVEVTHDNDTTKGWYRKLPGAQREALQKQLGTTDWEIIWAMIREALTSQSDTAIVPAQDLLELGSEARMNSPGIAKGNWQWRLKDGALTQELAQRLRSITRTCGRLRSGESRPAPRYQEDAPTPQIAKRAYELYERRGCQNGQSVQDWLQAEREIRGNAHDST
jgi:hypothetical protein